MDDDIVFRELPIFEDLEHPDLSILDHFPPSPFPAGYPPSPAPLRHPMMFRSPNRQSERRLNNVPDFSDLDVPPHIIERLKNHFSVALSYHRFHSVELNLAGCDLDGEIFRKLLGVLDKNPLLLTLDLSNNVSLGRSLSTPTFFQNLRSLSLYGCNLDDTSMKSLSMCLGAAHSAIEDLDISVNDISSEGAKYVAHILEDANTIFSHGFAHLNLAHNHLGDEGCNIIFSALRHNRSVLKELYIGHNFITERSSRFMQTTLYLNTSLKKLELSDNFLEPFAVAELEENAESVSRRRKLQGIIAFAYGSLSTTGRDSIVKDLPNDVLQIIGSMVLNTSQAGIPWLEYGDLRLSRS